MFHSSRVLFLGAIEHRLCFALFRQLSQDGIALALLDRVHLLAVQVVRDASAFGHLG